MVIKNTLFILVVLAFMGCRKVPNNYSANELPQAQTTPPDMVFVWGDGSIPSFYMGVSEECNINYQIYRNWQKQIFVDYPEVYTNSEPKNRDVSHLLQFNDPYYSYYQNHEAFAYYPVVGLSWVQAMDYLQWKGDRLNEKILFEIGVHNEGDLYKQQNENNFNTEAYLSGQYQGVVKRDLIDENPYGTTRKVRYNDGVLFATPRLPTEAEWEYALATQPAKPINAKTYSNPFSKEAMFPFGREYYTFIFGQKRGLEFYEHFEKGFLYHVKYDSIPQKPDRLTGAADYDLKAAGIANLEGNVPEWLMDEYTDEPEYNTLSFLDYFTKYCAEITEDTMLYDINGKFSEKDSLGKMPFYIFGIPNSEDYKTPLYFTRYHAGIWLENGYTKEYLDSTKNKIRAANYNLCYTKNTINEPEYISYKVSRFYCIVKRRNPNGTHTFSNNLCPEYFECYGGRIQKDSVGYYYKSFTYKKFTDTANNYRVVKGGSWKVPNAHKREKMHENDASPNIGFRAVITYTGFPVYKKKYKVKWK